MNADNYDWSDIRVYSWGYGFNDGVVWPGEQMTQYVLEDKIIWSHTFKGNPTHIIFNNGVYHTDEFEFVANGLYTQNGYVGTMDLSSTPDVLDNSIEEIISIEVSGKNLIIICSETAEVDITSLNGVSYKRCLSQGLNVIENLSKGFYIINGKKVII